jgi:3-dehydroquinate dehydratase-1
MTKICVPINEKENAVIIEKLFLAKKLKADLAEIWIGEVQNPDFQKIITESPLPVIVNCKGNDEQGSFSGTEEEKAHILLQSAEARAEYIDFSADFYFRFMQEEKFLSVYSTFRQQYHCKTIISLHYFHGTPGFLPLSKKISTLTNLNPDIIKCAAVPKTLKDVVTMIRLAEKLSAKNIPHILLSMGKLGKITRIASPILNNEIMFAPLDTSQKTASGQISLKNLHEIYKIL